MAALLPSISFLKEKKTNSKVIPENKIRAAIWFILCLFTICISACVEPVHPYSELAPGQWRGVLYIDGHLAVKPGINVRKTEGMELHESNSTGELPFTFEIVYDNDSTWHLVLINGEERLVERNVSMGRSKGSGNDTVRIDFSLFDTHMHAVVKEDIMQGYWYVHSKENYRIPFTAHHGKTYRFVELIDKKPSIDIDGKWEVTFRPDTEDQYKAIGEFTQQGRKLYGTFMTETGDYRFQSGIVEDDKLWLSSFDGTHAFLFNAKLMPDSSLSGIFRSGKHFTADWVAIRNEAFKLRDPDSMSVSTNNEFSLLLPDHEGNMISFPGPTNGRAKILQISGTWCPNCMDETLFLIEYIKNNPGLALDIYGIFFERYADPGKALPILTNYRNTLGVNYPMLFGGKASKKNTSEVLTMIDEVRSYPTLIFMDKNHQIRKIHTGFAGPATSKYKEFQLEFDQFVRLLSNE